PDRLRLQRDVVPKGEERLNDPGRGLHRHFPVTLDVLDTPPDGVTLAGRMSLTPPVSGVPHSQTAATVLPHPSREQFGFQRFLRASIEPKIHTASGSEFGTLRARFRALCIAVDRPKARAPSADRGCVRGACRPSREET